MSGTPNQGISQRAYAELNTPTQQAPLSTANGNSLDPQYMILIELQVISFILAQACNTAEDLAQLRANVAASIFN